MNESRGNPPMSEGSFPSGTEVHDRYLQLFLKHQHALKAFIVSVIRDWHRSEDVFQEVSLVLWKKFRQYDADTPFGAWARGVAAREILKDRERWRRAGLLLSAEAILAVKGAYDKEEAQLGPKQQVLQECIKRLPPHSLRLLELRYHEELPIQSISDQVRGSVEAVTKTLSRIRTALEECVKQTLVKIDEART